MNVEDLKEQIRTKGAELVHLVDEVLLADDRYANVPGLKSSTVVRDAYANEAKVKIHEAVRFAIEAADRL